MSAAVRYTSSGVDESARARREQRLRTLQIRSFPLGEEPSDDLSDLTTATERLAMMWPLAVRAWELSGRELPQYTRATIPTRIVRADVSETPLAPTTTSLSPAGDD